MKLIARLLAIARQRHHHVTTELDGWTARPLKVSNTLSLWVHASKLSSLRSRLSRPMVMTVEYGYWQQLLLSYEDVM
jgi:hypothetical protein